jgi:uncharacterized membrane protein
MNKIEKIIESPDLMVKVVYILYLVGLFSGVTWLVGVVIAYVKKDEAPDWLKSHYQFQIRTFWIGLLYFFISGLFSMIFIGYLGFLFCYVWLIIRSVKGLQLLESQNFHPEPKSWLF